jgi:hypothetical protein
MTTETTAADLALALANLEAARTKARDAAASYSAASKAAADARDAYYAADAARDAAALCLLDLRRRFAATLPA